MNSIRDNPLFYIFNNLRSRSVVFRGETLNLSRIVPCEKGKSRTNYIMFERIKSDLNIYTFKEILQAKFKKEWTEEIKLADHGKFFTYQYLDFPVLFILKDDGKIYSEHNNNMAKFEAFRLMRALVKFGAVQGYERIQQKKTKQSFEGWVD
jgi:hypothetical protein